MILVADLGGRCLFKRIDADELSAAAFIFELHNTFDKRKQSVILPATDILSGFPLGAPLPRKNVATEHTLTAKLLQPQSLGLLVAAVTR